MFHSFKCDNSPTSGLSFMLDSRLRIQTKGKPRVNLMLYHNPIDDSIEFTYPWILPISAKLRVTDSSSNCEFIFNKNYLRFSSIVAEGWELIDVFRSLLQIRLIESGMYMIHGAVLRFNERGILIPSFGNTGKTTTSWMLAKRGAEFLTDEFAVLNQRCECFGFPCSSLVSSDLVSAIDLDLSVMERIRLMISEVKSRMLTTRFAPGGIKLYPDRFFRTNELTPVDAVVLIQNGVDSVERITPEEGFSRIMAIQSYEMNWRANPFVIARSFFHREFRPTSISFQEEQFVKTLLSRVKDVYLVSSSLGQHYRHIESLLG